MKVKQPPHDTKMAKRKGLKRKPKVIVIHTVESEPVGQGGRHGIIRYLDGRGISVPWVDNETGNTKAVPDGYLGYGHSCGLSSVATGIEQGGFARYSRKYWLREKRETIRNTGRIVAYIMHEQMGLEVTVRNLERHVIGHFDDHRFGGCSDHWDPGPGYPFSVMFEDAIDYAAGQGWRAVATKGERRRVHRFRRAKALRAWVRIKRRQGWRVITRKAPLKAGE